MSSNRIIVGPDNTATAVSNDGDDIPASIIAPVAGDADVEVGLEFSAVTDLPTIWITTEGHAKADVFFNNVWVLKVVDGVLVPVTDEDRDGPTVKLGTETVGVIGEPWVPYRRKLREAVKAVARAARGGSNDREIAAMNEAISLALVRAPKGEAAKVEAELAKLADGDSNDGEIEGLQDLLKSALGYWPEIDQDAIAAEVENEDD
jgi:hypothetical protein